MDVVLLMKPQQRGATSSVSGLVLDNMAKQGEDLKTVKEPAMGALEKSN